MIEQILKKYQQIGIKFSLNEGSLKIDVPKKILNDEILLELRNHREEILTYLQMKTLRHDKNISKICYRGEKYALSAAQQRFWALCQPFQGQNYYNVHLALQFKEKINIDKLQTALDLLVIQNESLRTCYIIDNGDIYQQIISPYSVPLTILAALKKPIDNKFEELILKPFDLEDGQLIRSYIYNDILLIVIPHIAIDAFSLDLLRNSLLNFYASDKPELYNKIIDDQLQYLDFALWQNKLLNSNAFHDQIEYWKNELAECTVASLCTDYLPSSNPSAESLSFCLDANRIQLIKSLIIQQQATLPQFFLATFKLLLSRFCHQDDLTIGVPVSNRSSPELARIIGCIINTVVIRSELKPDYSFIDYLHVVKNKFLQSLANQDVPYEQLIEVFIEQNSPDLNKNDSFFSVLYSYERVNQDSSYDFLVSPYHIKVNTPKMDLSVYVTENNNELKITFEYRFDLFSSDTIQNLLSCFDLAITQILLEPYRPMSQISLATDEQRNKLFNWSRDGNYSKFNVTINEIFEQIARKYPECPAIKYQTQLVNYKELDSLTNQIANQFIAHSTHSEIIGILLDRGIGSITTMLAIIKTGKVYLPIDPKYPDERILYIINDADINTIVTDNQQFNRIQYLITSHQKQIRIINLDTISNDDLTYPSISSPKISFTSPCCVIYTSGSTGNPKGAIIPHQAIIRLVTHIEYIKLDQQDCIAHLASLSFDAATFEIFGALLNGGCIVIFDNEEVLLPEKFSQKLNDEKISTLFLTTSLFNQMAMHNPNMFGNVKNLLVGGEALNIKTIQLVLNSASPPLRLLNGYGPTENTTFTCCHHIQKLNSQLTNIPIGRPISNTCVYILDKYLHLAPIGAKGRLYTGGPGLALGYLNRNELSQELFIESPFYRPGLSKKLYDIRDYVRWNPSGNIEYLGRCDRQVKIRGFRIELAEIESHLLQHLQIKQAIVTAIETDYLHKKLVCFILTATDELSASQVHQFLQDRLPAYMIPSDISVFKKFPLTLNGKINISVLLANLSNKFFIPSTQYVDSHIKQQISQIWRDILKINSDDLNVDAHFFELGGDSIIAIQLIAKLNSLGYQLRPTDLFTHPTIRKLGDLLESSHKIALKKVDEPSEITGVVINTPIQKWFFKNYANNLHPFNQSILFQLPVLSHLEFFEQIIEYLLSYHDELRAIFNLNSRTGEWSQTVRETYDLKSSYRLRIHNQNKNISAIIAEAHNNININHGPLISFDYIIEENKSLILFVCHHLVIDGVSWRILIEDFYQLYQQIIKSFSLTLPKKTKSYQFWAKYLSEYSCNNKLKEEKEFWLGQLFDPNKTIYLNALMNCDSNIIYSNINQSPRTTKKWVLDPKISKIILTSLHKLFNTQINDVLLAGLVISFFQVYELKTHSKLETYKLWLNLEGHGREVLDNHIIDVSRTIGWFTSIFPLSIEISSTDIIKAIKQCKQQLKMVPNKGVGYGILKYLTNIPELNIAQPIISFNYLGQFLSSINSELVVLEDTVSQELSSSHYSNQALEIVGYANENGIHFEFNYATDYYQEEIINQLINHYKQYFDELIQLYNYQIPIGFVPADIPLAGINQAQIDNLYQEIQSTYKKPIISEIEDIYTLSPLQQGIFFHHLYDFSDQAYLIQTRFSIQEKINIQYFKMAWERLLHSHPILRNAFFYTSTEVVLQVTFKTVTLPWQEIDFTGFDPKSVINELDTLFKREKGMIDLTKPPLMRICLVKIEDNHYKVIWTFHHIILDGWSVSILLSQVNEYYQQLLNQYPLLIRNDYLFRNYIEWLKHCDQASAKKYWQALLKGIDGPSQLNLLTISSSNTNINASAKQIKKQLSFDVTSKIIELTKKIRITLSSFLQSLWGIVVSRYSGKNSILFGSITSGRSPKLVNVEKMVGLLINLIPIRIDLDSNIPLIEFFQQVHQQFLNSRDYEYSSLSEIKHWIGVNLQQQLFDTIFIFENYPELSSDYNNSFHFKHFEMVETTNYPVSLVAWLDKSSLIIRLDYQQNYLGNYANSVLDFFLELITKSINFDNLRSLPTLPENDRNCLAKWNNTEMRLPKSKTLYQQFEIFAQSHPDHFAIHTCDHGSVTYADFLKKVESVAAHLAVHGVCRTDRVGIHAERGMPMLVMLMAALRLGAIYVPLDPHYPFARIQSIIADCLPKIILVEKNTDLEIFSPFNLTVSYENFEQNTHHLNDYDGLLEDTAYIIYTSGSTGKPKGVAVSNYSLLNYIIWFSKEFNVTPFSVFDFSSSLAFDFSVTCTLLPLINGSQIAICPEIIKMDTKEYLIYLTRYNVTHIKCTPSYFTCLLEFPSLIKSSHDLNYIIIGGEAIKQLDLAKWFAFNPGALIVNEYGPTETTVATVAYTVTCENIYQYGDYVPIGKPAYNCQLYVLNQSLQLCPVGVAGELYISGLCLAKGYFNNPTMTESVFINNPFLPGKKMYKTGDVVRWTQDGQLLYHGRNDNQIKLRGFRIELDAISNCLVKFPGVAQAVILPHCSNNHLILIAFFISPDSQDLNEEVLSSHLRKYLPEYMVPTSILPIDHLPLTINGKLDQAQLIAIYENLSRPSLIGKKQPATILEKKLAFIWSELLNIPPESIDIQANFFAMGGDSITSIQLIAKLKSENYQITPRIIFENPTIASLAMALEKNSDKNQTEPCCEQTPISGFVHPTPIQKWFFQETARNIHYYNQSAVFKLTEPVSYDIFIELFRLLFIYHDNLRSRFIQEENEIKHYIQDINQEQNQPSFRGSYFDLSELKAEEQKKFIAKENLRRQSDLNIHVGPIAQLVYYKLADSPAHSIICMVFHHLVIDGVSWRIILADLQTWYAQKMQRQPYSYTKTTSFQYWAKTLHEHVHQGIQDVANKKEYWLNELKLIQKPNFNYPIKDYAFTFGTAKDLQIVLPFAESRSLIKLVYDFYNTSIEVILLSALVYTISPYYPSDSDILLELEGHGRENIAANIDLSKTLGWFTTLFPVKLPRYTQQDLQTLVEKIRHKILNIPIKGLEFGLLRYIANDTTGHLNPHAYLPIGFNYLGQYTLGTEKQLLQRIEEEKGCELDLLTKRAHCLDINAWLNEQGLIINWTYDINVFTLEMIESLVNQYLLAIREFIHVGMTAERAVAYSEKDWQHIKNEAIISLSNSCHHKLNFFCVHPGGGTIDRYVNLAKHLEGINFYGLQDPSMFDIGHYFNSLEDMATCYVQAIKTIQPEGPYYIGGWSYGGTVAYEMAHQLLKMEETIGLLVMFDSWNLPHAEIDIEQFDINLYKNLLQQHKFALSEDLVNHIQKSMRRRALNKKNYRYPDINLNIELFKCDTIPEDSPFFPYQSTVNCWNELKLLQISVSSVKGDHFQLMDEPYAANLANEFNSLIKRIKGVAITI